MKLISCYIRGFGGLSDYSVTFSEGLNEIYHENGWGKSTFSCFIKSMFYGMEYSPRRKDLMDREHFYPWDADGYGGSLTFCANNKRYRIERSFGKKRSEDRFCLYDDKTGRVSSDYTENIGEELFGVDLESFMKSVYVPQDRPESNMTDSLNAKIGHLETSPDDVNQFDNAMQKLDEARKRYIKTGGQNSGRLVEVRNEIRHARGVAETIPALTDAYSKKQNQLDQRNRELYSCKRDREKLNAAISKRMRVENEIGAYNQRVSQLEENKAQLSRLDDFFASGVPTEQEQSVAEEMEHQIRADRTAIMDREKVLPVPEEQKRLSDLFAYGIPSDVDRKTWKKNADRLMELRMQSRADRMTADDMKELAGLKEYFVNGVPDSNEIDMIQNAEQDILTLEGQKKELIESIGRDEKLSADQGKNGSFSSRVLGLIMTIALLLGGVFFARKSVGNTGVIFSGICFIISGAVFVLTVYGYLSERRKKTLEKEAMKRKISGKRERLKEIERRISELNTARENFMDSYQGESDNILGRIREVMHKADRYEHLKKREDDMLSNTSDAVDELTGIQLSLYTALKPYADQYGADLYHDMNEQEVITRIEKDVKSELDLLESYDHIERLRRRVNDNRQRLYKYLERFPIDNNVETTQKLSRIRSNKELYIKLQSESDRLIGMINSMPENDTGSNETIEELQNRLSSIDRRIEELNRLIPKDMEDVSAMSDMLAQDEETAYHLDELLAEEKKMTHRVDVITAAMDYLKEAKDRFMMRYMTPLRAGMDKYLSVLLKNCGQGAAGAINPAADEIELDMDLSIRFRHKGQTLSDRYLSRGYRSLTSLCARFALIDMLYNKEKPVVILDDPFSDLDDDKIRSGMALLKELSKDRQIIYFTCHRSRMSK